MYCNVDQWIEIRRRVLNREISKRQACQEYELHWQTLKKILSQPVPPEHREPGPPRPSKLDPFRPAIQAMLDSDRQAHASSGIRPSGSSSGCGTSTATTAATRSSRTRSGS